MKFPFLHFGLLLFISLMMLVKGDYLNPYRLVIIGLLWSVCYISLYKNKAK